jgi:hypothetical protein
MKKPTLLLTLVFATTLCHAQFQVGFDFRLTQSFVTDKSPNLPVLPSFQYPIQGPGVTFGWTNLNLVQGRDRVSSNDPRLAGVDIAINGYPASFLVDLPAPGTYVLSLALGDAGYSSCWVKCAVLFYDGVTLLKEVDSGSIPPQYFADMLSAQWSYQGWPGSNQSVPVTLAGTRLTMTIGTNAISGDSTSLAFLGITQEGGAGGTFDFLRTLQMMAGGQDQVVLTFAPTGGFGSDIQLSVGDLPEGISVSLSPSTIPGGNGQSLVTASATLLTVPGSYPIMVIADGGGVRNTLPLEVVVQ